jgi:RNAse (barnase) inhibitor barstar
MNKRNAYLFILYLLVAVVFASCTNNEKDKLHEKIKEQILLHEKEVTQIDSLKILEIDSLTRYGYIKVILEQLEYMEYDFYTTLNTDFDLSDSAYTELEIMLTEVQDLIDLYRGKTEENTDNETFFCYFVETEVWSSGEAQIYYYLISKDFKILDDPFDQVIE